VNPLMLMIPGILSCSCAFMLPVATPPNAIVFGTGRLKVSDMSRVGVILNLIGVLIVTTAVMTLGKGIFRF
jgi:sodium-dependent dicarboxylate transporter 2/3/5